MKRQLTTDEVQEVLKQFQSYLQNLKTRWDAENPGNNSWWAVHRTYLLKGCTFIINSLDEAIQLAEQLIPGGKDKKAVVLAVIGHIFDYIVVQAFPFYLRPLAPMIKKVFIEVVISNLIDFIVEKYNAGFWRMEPNGQQENKT